MAKPLKVDWEKIKLTAVSGVPLIRCAEIYDVPYTTIKQRCHREKWPHPRTRGERIKEGQNKDVTKVSLRESAEAAGKGIQAHLDKIGEDNAALIAEKVSQHLAKRMERPLPALEDWSGISTAFKVVEQATGRNKPVNAIQVNVGQVWSESLGTEATVRLA